ncbi:unnamed protein product [Didymodactylos carnosus]|uniref:G domain-containing protein n=1 Tax=Didymodactylos carnosus TaxID=1234261 RepID=A0A815BF32_9BILA|nr:unnamed protein product [Didymodactylos carnosus]CAF1266735.1 unnamed protein product [Didymodactylos carnosus]CAF4042071.1 unnamed protein product [Didymodactylos carnosus]CAF4050470.1 unnamed protein product [Didymodactylos carnosus]
MAEEEDHEKTSDPYLLSNDDYIESNRFSIVEENIEPDRTPLDAIQDKLGEIVREAASRHNLSNGVVLNRLAPIDILNFGRSGVGKSCLLKAITKADIPTSSQLDHVTETLQEVRFNSGKLTFRFWDTKGIDKWSSSEDVDNMLNEIKRKSIDPLFIIYCASGSGRVDTKIVIQILKHLQSAKVPIAYVITNIYGHSDDQLEGQIDGGLDIMRKVFSNQTDPVKKNEWHYEFSEPLYMNSSDCGVMDWGDGKGLLIGVNSAPWESKALRRKQPLKNVYELMDFIANNLKDKEFAEFVALTLNNRGYWARASDVIKTKIQSIADILQQWSINMLEHVKYLYSSPKKVHRNTV